MPTVRALPRNVYGFSDRRTAELVAANAHKLEKIYERYQYPQPSPTPAQPYQIAFQIVSLDESTRVALCTVIGIIGSNRTVADIPGQTGVSGVVDVCDFLGCFFNEPAADMTGREGFATWMTPLVTTQCQPDEYNLEAQWVVTAVCCDLPGC